MAKVAQQSHAQLINVEVYCSDESIHRQRLEQRPSNFTERPKVTWLAVKQRDYEPWSESPGRESLLRLDTAHNSVAANLELLQAHIIGTDQS